MHTIAGSCEKDSVLIILFLHFMVLRLGFLKLIYSGFVKGEGGIPPVW